MFSFLVGEIGAPWDTFYSILNLGKGIRAYLVNIITPHFENSYLSIYLYINKHLRKMLKFFQFLLDNISLHTICFAGFSLRERKATKRNKCKLNALYK